jgi:hypothetical protein
LYPAGSKGAQFADALIKRQLGRDRKVTLEGCQDSLGQVMAKALDIDRRLKPVPCRDRRGVFVAARFDGLRARREPAPEDVLEAFR